MQPGETWREVQPPDPKKPNRTDKPSNVHEWRIHPHHWRTELEQSMLGKSAANWHLPKADALPEFYIRSLNAEDQTLENRRMVGGGFEEIVVWVPRVTSQTDETVNVRKDIHWADCEKMHLALADILGINKQTERQANNGPRVTDVEDLANEAFDGGVW
jgi:hypothetical protein